jgi:hypothetical protein
MQASKEKDEWSVGERKERKTLSRSHSPQVTKANEHSGSELSLMSFLEIIH